MSEIIGRKSETSASGMEIQTISYTGIDFSTLATTLDPIDLYDTQAQTLSVQVINESPDVLPADFDNASTGVVHEIQVSNDKATGWAPIATGASSITGAGIVQSVAMPPIRYVRVKLTQALADAGGTVIVTLARDVGGRFPSLVIPFDEQIALNRVPGAYFINKWGHNPDIDSGTAEDVWDAGGTWQAPTAASQHSIVSTDAADNPAGIGAGTIRVEGLDENYAEQLEFITMDGLTPVLTVGSYWMIHRVQATQADGGTNDPGDFNVGTITATTTGQVADTVTAQINPGTNSTQMAIYQIPAGKIGTPKGLSFGGFANATTEFVMDIGVQPFGDAWTLFVQQEIQNYGELLSILPTPLDEKTTVKIRVISDTQNARFTAGFSLKILPKDL